MTFKVGDKVRRINRGWCDVKVGDVDVVEAADARTHVLRLVGRRGDFSMKNFEKVGEVKTTPHKHAALIKAWADGAEIEYRPGPDCRWYKLAMQTWDMLGEFRIKPEPKPDVVRYMCYIFPAGESSHWSSIRTEYDNIKAAFDGETGKLKKLDIIETGETE